MIWVCLLNAVMMICFSALAIYFDHWWIVLFSALFFVGYKHRTSTEDGKEADMKMIDVEKLRDILYYGKNDEPIFDEETDRKLIELIDECTVEKGEDNDRE